MFWGVAHNDTQCGNLLRLTPGGTDEMVQGLRAPHEMIIVVYAHLTRLKESTMAKLSLILAISSMLGSTLEASI